MVVLLLALACANPAENKSQAEVVPPAPKTTAPAAPATPPAPAAPAAPANEIALKGTVGFIGAKVTKSHEGVFNTWTGSASVANNQLASIKFEVQVASLKTDAEKLDNHLKGGDFFDTAQFPTATFVSTSVTPGAPADSKLAGANATVEGDLTMRGTTQRVRFPAIIEVSGNTVKAKTEFAINRQQFKITYPGKPDDLIRDEVVIKVDVQS